MDAHPLPRPAAVPYRSPLIAETRLLDLFAPASPACSINLSRPRSEHAALWQADAVHRAKNMAQMTLALASIAANPDRTTFLIQDIVRVRRLARTFEVLGDDSDGDTPVPCALLLTEIVSGLVDIFGHARCALQIPPSSRRALAATHARRLPARAA